ncbi:hypothetical protein F2Q68_00003507 [Brassica cretica]|uniref:CCHC-type domain-containing protein n=1 Tax=Brassica cretica TaxID=69181 RepID=A0A8S9JPF6_BRACR|nr:hypothetical protein F2Q68_00003507 [Brassica cretica]
MANRGIGDDGRGRIWGEGMDWTCRGLGYRSDQDDGNGVSEMFGHDRSPLQRTRSFPIFGNRTRAEDWVTDLIRMMEMALVRCLDTIGDLCKEHLFRFTAERKTIPHSGGHTKFSQGDRPNFNKGPRLNKGKGRGFRGQANDRGNTGVCYTCDKPGHISRFCPKNQRNNQRSNQLGYSSIRMEDVTCFSCGIMKGHYALSCPNKTINATLSRSELLLAVQQFSQHQRSKT